jgi:plasmid stability protein
MGDIRMAAVTVRGLSDEVHRALRVRAARHGRSTEAEIRSILEEAALPKERVKLGTLLSEIGRRYGGVDLDIARDQSVTDPKMFE